MSDKAPEPTEVWARVEALLDRALDLGRDERESLLATAEDQAVVAQVRELLAEAEREGGPLDQHPTRLTEEAMSTWAGAAEPRARLVGAWRLLEPLGTGGMGRVFLAERAGGDFEQRAAVKILRWEVETPELEERFRRERQLLARLEHPGIARLIDGGVSEEGLPYLVLELVEGEPIDAFSHGRPLQERLDLFLQVCDAVNAAHRRLIIHRDLKPSNILVTRDGRVKLLDFGVGKLLETTEDRLTRTRPAPATPDFAAPEQLTGGEVTTGTDVYALGVLLYELLTESRPFGPDEVRASDRYPRPPSSRVSGRLPARLRGDLDNITLTAMRSDPGRRYASVDRLAADVRRYMEGRPVDATPETLGYRARKFVRRNRVAALGASLVALALVLGLATTAWQARKARQEAFKATKVAGFLSSVISSANPYNRDARAQSLEDVLHEASARLETELTDQPEVRAALLVQVGTGYYRLLRRDTRAWEILAEAEGILEGSGPSRELADLWLLQAALASERGEYALQRDLARRARGYFERSDGAASEGVARALLSEALASQYEGDLETAYRTGQRALEILEALPDAPPLLIAECLARLGDFEELRKNHTESIELKRRALDLFETAGGQHDPDVISLFDKLGISYHALGRLDEAEASYRNAVERVETRFGPDHPHGSEALTDLSRLLLDQGRFGEALEFAARSVQASAGIPESDFERIAAEINLATAELETGSVVAAEERYRLALERFIGALGEDHPAVARCRSLLADALRRLGDLEQAEVLYRLALHPENRRLHEAWLGLGRVLMDSGRTEEATGLLDQALTQRLETLPEEHWRIAEVRAEQGLLETRRGRPTDAGADRARLALAAALGADNWRLARLSG